MHARCETGTYLSVIIRSLVGTLDQSRHDHIDSITLHVTVTCTVAWPICSAADSQAMLLDEVSSHAITAHIGHCKTAKLPLVVLKPDLVQSFIAATLLYTLRFNGNTATMLNAHARKGKAGKGRIEKGRKRQEMAECEKAEGACLRVVATSPLPSGTSPADHVATAF